MPVFRLSIVSEPDGTFAPAWFDDEACLWNDERLITPAPLASTWQPQALRLHRPAEGATPVLFNPNAIAVSRAIRDQLAPFSEIELLPLHIENHGEYYILHVTASVELPQGCKVRFGAPPSGNIVELFAFPRGYQPPFAFFRVMNPEGSAARRIAATELSIFMSSAGAQAIAQAAAGYLVASEMPAA